ncbi:hypothetical protein BDB00DRAFT_161622 [Zychaea mexicana]|uniref:uncharacterized protein n=1 Tax=Zychaea mexicana TaxID=64656 RepID=UPI0022FDE0A4|nr:uncharacterized protein BDB00DRAFT_161622 [Zychaea mexicana]KAI9482590.1 hypothetical protein BDB00DRAFT_161622 [Zychaea mexicana]
MHPESRKFFNNDLVKKLLRPFDTTVKFPNDVMVKLMEIVWDFYYGRRSRLDTCAKITSLLSAVDDLDIDDLDKKIIMSIHQLCLSLPSDRIMNDTSENNYCTRYLAPALQPLFDDDETNTQILWPTTVPANKRSFSLANRRPDCIISTLMDNNFEINIGYGEVKSAAEYDNHYQTNMDLLRLGHFCKDTIDEHKLQASLGIHVVGPNLTYYLMELKADGLYLMEELVTIRMPLCIKDIPAYLASLSQIKNVTHHFYHHCKQSDASAMIIISKRNRVSPTAENLDHVIEKTIDRKRHNHVKY